MTCRSHAAGLLYLLYERPVPKKVCQYVAWYAVAVSGSCFIGVGHPIRLSWNVSGTKSTNVRASSGQVVFAGMATVEVLDRPNRLPADDIAFSLYPGDSMH
jgi:hypothetical protein